MLKKWTTWLLVLLLTATMVLPVAAEEANAPFLETGYYDEGTLHLYTAREDLADKSLPVMVDGITAAVPGTVESVVLDQTPVHYLLLVDCSTSMEGMKSRIAEFAQALFGQEQLPVRITLSAFGDSFSVLREDVTTEAALLEALETLSFNQFTSDICGAAVEAMDYLYQVDRQEGEITSLVMITDGQPYFSAASEENKETAAEEASLRLANRPETVLHTLCLGVWEQSTLEALSGGTGLHLAGIRDIKAAGRAIAEYTDSLLGMHVAMDWSEDQDARDVLLMQEGSLLTVGSIPNLAVVQETAETEEETPTEEPPAEEEQPPVEEETPAEEPPAEEEQPPAEEAATDALPQETMEETAAADSVAVPKLWLFIGGGVLVAVLLLCVLLALRKPKKEQGVAPIRMRLEVLDGSCKGNGKDYYLKNELLIGSARSCDIVLGDKSVANCCARVFRQEQMIYIEDLTEQPVTAIGGMKIYTPNRLRSGDEIAIGSTRFRLLF